MSVILGLVPRIQPSAHAVICWLNEPSFGFVERWVLGTSPRMTFANAARLRQIDEPYT